MVLKHHHGAPLGPTPGRGAACDIAARSLGDTSAPYVRNGRDPVPDLPRADAHTERDHSARDDPEDPQSSGLVIGPAHGETGTKPYVERGPSELGRRVDASRQPTTCAASGALSGESDWRGPPGEAPTSRMVCQVERQGRLEELTVVVRISSVMSAKVGMLMGVGHRESVWTGYPLLVAEHAASVAVALRPDEDCHHARRTAQPLRREGCRGLAAGSMLTVKKTPDRLRLIRLRIPAQRNILLKDLLPARWRRHQFRLLHPEWHPEERHENMHPDTIR